VNEFSSAAQLKSRVATFDVFIRVFIRRIPQNEVRK
jgi:hypothetical protein